MNAFPQKGTERRPRKINREIQTRNTVQFVDPISCLLRRCFRLRPPIEPCCKVAKLNRKALKRRRQVSRVSVIQSEYLALDQIIRDKVCHKVMHHNQRRMVPRSHSVNRGAQKRPPAHIERSAYTLRDETLHML